MLAGAKSAGNLLAAPTNNLLAAIQGVVVRGWGWENWVVDLTKVTPILMLRRENEGNPRGHEGKNVGCLRAKA